MFPFSYRLPLRQQEDFFSQSKRVSSPSLTLWYKAGGGEFSQGGVVVPKTVAAQATRRNRLKRQARELLLPYLKQTKKQQFMLQLRRPSLTKNFQELADELRELMDKVV